MSIPTHCKKDSEHPLKRCYLIGTTWVVGIDTEIATKLKISEQDTIFEQQIVEEGILMRVRKSDYKGVVDIIKLAKGFAHIESS